ncbi:DUF2125 domain-containing protein [Neotabrizicola sp. VNH66]|uniref:DUF2125 domain-containing protein n=1 Tax=Neotabrizicola sp. VNH66 TaxID=3400918 RepID=UPI003C075666
MRWLLGFAAVLTSLWCGYWFVGKTVIERQASAFLAAQAAEGRRAETTSLSVGGFPNRFDLTAEGIDFADPAQGLSWQAPFVQVFAMTWKPWHLIAAFAETQTIGVPGETLTLTSDGLMASARTQPSLDLTLAEARVATRTLTVVSSQGWTAGLGESAAALRATPGEAATYDLGVQLTRFVPDPRIKEALAQVVLPGLPASDLPAEIERLHLDARLGLSAPLDRQAGQTRPQLLSVDLRDLSLVWGELAIVAKGRLDPDAQGFAAGRIEVSVTNWDRLPPLLVAAGLVKPEIAPTVTNLLRALAADGGDPATLTLPLVLQGGQMSVGPLPLGPAPLLVPPAGG